MWECVSEVLVNNVAPDFQDVGDKPNDWFGEKQTFLRRQHLQ